MSFRDQLQSGSFRGVPFYTLTVEGEIGRRVVTHEYPNRDKPYNEDLGRASRGFTVECYVSGDSYMVDRNALTEALEAKNSGTLIHPFWGEMQAQAVTTRIKESSDQEGVAYFSIKFIEAGDNENPASNNDTAALIDLSADDLLDAANADFLDKYTVDGVPEFVRQAAVDVTQKAFDLMSALPSLEGGIDFDMTDLIAEPEQLAKQIQDTIASVSDVIDFRSLEALSLPEIKQSTATRVKQAINQGAIIDLIKTSTIAQKAKLLVSL
ncbi:DNA circularization N-terminal domain-containing protein [Pseudomonadota bacterium]|nr:DNA circularization N-terminal domain-containing protein [Pseudomonadota bacterium]